MKLKEYNQMMAYLTRPRDSLRKIIKKKKDTSNYMVANGTFKTENQISESIPDYFRGYFSNIGDNMERLEKKRYQYFHQD